MVPCVFWNMQGQLCTISTLLKTIIHFIPCYQTVRFINVLHTLWALSPTEQKEQGNSRGYSHEIIKWKHRMTNCSSLCRDSSVSSLETLFGDVKFSRSRPHGLWENIVRITVMPTNVSTWLITHKSGCDDEKEIPWEINRERLPSTTVCSFYESQE